MPTARNRLANLARFASCFAVAGLLFGLASRSVAAEQVKPLRALLVIGGCCHDYGKQQEILAEGISARAHVQVTVAYDPDKTTKHLNPVYESPSWAQDYDVIIHDECSSDVKDPAIVERILAPHRNGLPGVLLHCGMHCYRTEGYPQAVTPWFEFTGLQSTGHGPQQPIAIDFVDRESGITKGLENWLTVNEELYNNSSGKLLDTAKALARGKQVYKNKQGDEVTAESVVVWTNNYAGKAKVFATTLGHNNQTVADPRYLDLVTRGLLWSCGKLDDAYLKPFDPTKQTSKTDEREPTLAPKK
jgi:type 1 glutamine amidotransferase